MTDDQTQQSPDDHELEPIEEILEDFPEEERPIAKRALQKGNIIATSFSGPLPPPGIIAGYEEILPGSADRIFTMAENEQRHRHDVENNIVQADFQLQRWGLVAGFIVVIGVLVVSGLLTSQDEGLLGFAGVITAVGTVVSIFYYAQGRRQKERASSDEQQDQAP